VLGRKFSGAIFAVSTTAGLLVIIYRITIRMFYALDPILSSAADKTLHWTRFIDIVSHVRYDSWQVEGICLAFLLLCWIAAGLHAYLAGRRMG
jgi:hypothetical protein